MFVIRKPEYFGQVLAALVVGIGPFSAGLAKGYSSPGIASLLSRDASGFPITNQQASWIASLSLLGALFGAPFGGAAVRWGRKRTLILAGIPLTICWIATVFAISVEIMYCSAFFSGFLISIMQLASQVYISEIASPNIRGGLSGMLKVAGHIGTLVSFSAGAFLNWRELAALIAVAPASMCLTIWKIPESPGWLVLQGFDDEAEKSLRWLRGHSTDLRMELNSLRENIPATNRSNRPQIAWKALQTPALIACGLMFFQRFSGANAFNFYVVSVFRETFAVTNPHSAAVAVAIVQLLSSLLSGLLVDRAGRLPLLVASSVLMSLALSCFGSFTYYENAHPKSLPQLDWIPLLCVLIFTVAFSLGINPISWLIVTELFPLEHRGVGTALATGFSYFCAFVGVKTFVDFQEYFGLHGAFWIYAAISICGLCFVVCCVPETKGRDLAKFDS